MEEDQEKFLDDALKIVKSQAFHMNKTIENNQLRQCLKEASIMLSELKTSLLTPRNYYHLYTIIFDEMQYLEGYFKEEYRRGRKIKDLYDAVQQASSIIPRLYLLISVGSVYIESQQVPASEIIFDLLQMVKGVQNPLRGLFTRYYLLKMIKDKLPDVGNEYEGEKSTLADTLKFILQNLEEMNRLWIRLSTGCTGNERLLREKERNELKVLVGENITRLASLQGLTLQIYQEEVLPKIINILLDSKDQLSQQYLMECIIHAFPDDYNIQCMSTILDTCTKLVPTVDIKSLFIALMEKLAKFVGDTGRNQEDVMESAEKIFDLLKLNIDKIIEEGAQGSMDTLKLIELQVAFMKFTLKGCPNKLQTVNHILNSSVNILSKTRSDYKLSLDGIKLIGRLLSVPLESTLSIFEMPQFPTLMSYLDFSSRSTLSLRIIESLVNGSSVEKLDSVEKVTILLDFIKPLLADSSDANELDQYQFEYEQQSVAKLIFIISNTNPVKQLEMLTLLKNVFLKGGNKRQKFTLPALVNAFFILASNVSHGYDAKLNNISETGKPLHDEFIQKYQIEFENSSEYVKYLQKLYGVINDTIATISTDYPEIGFKLYLNSLSQINDLKISREEFEENGYNFASLALSIIQEGKVEADKKLPLIILFVGTVTSINFLSTDNMSTITANLQQASQTLVKRSDQCIAMLHCAHLFFNDIVKDQAKVNECLTKAKRFADFAMTNAQNLHLFVLILNKYLFFIEKGTSFVKSDILNDIIEVVKNHILTIKTENTNATFLPEIEKYFEVTLDVISQRKKSATHQIFEEIII
jgi:vacuolar protein sorting-associated protein 35